MSTIKSSAENLTLNADGSGNDVLIQSNGSTKAIVTAEGTLGIGTTTPTQKLDVSGHLLFGNGRSNSAEKHGRFTAINYNTAVNPMCVIYANGASSGNFVRFGGGTDSVSPVTSFQFFTATGTPANGEGTKRATLDSDGLKFGTDTAAANALDDYEEGTFTPSLTFGGGATSMAYSTRQGSYVKVGKMCYISLRIVLSSKGSSSGAAIITGLPFTSGNVTGNFSKAGMAFANNWYGSVAGTQHHIHTVDGNTSAIQLRRLDDGGNYQTFTNSHMDDNVDMILCMTMRTA